MELLINLVLAPQGGRRYHRAFPQGRRHQVKIHCIAQGLGILCQKSIQPRTFLVGCFLLKHPIQEQIQFFPTTSVHLLSPFYEPIRTH